MSNCTTFNEVLNQMRSIGNNQNTSSPAISNGLCNPHSPPTINNNQPVPLPGGNRIDVITILNTNRIRKFRRQSEFDNPRTIETVNIRGIKNDFRLLEVDATRWNQSYGRNDDIQRLWGYDAENRQYYSIRNSEGITLFLGTRYFVQVAAYTDGAGYDIETSTVTLLVNNSATEPYPPDSSGGDGDDDDDEEQPPPCDISITSSFDTGYFCMTFDEYNRFISDIDRVEENLQRFQQ